MSVNHWEVLPYIGVGALRFGMSRADTRSLFDEVPTTYRRPYSTTDTDVYGSLCLHASYDSGDRLRYILTYESAPIRYKDIALLGRNLLDVINDLASMNITSRHDDDGYWFDEIGIALYAPEDIVQAVSVFKRGYYEEEVALAAKIIAQGEIVQEEKGTFRFLLTRFSTGQ